MNSHSGIRSNSIIYRILAIAFGVAGMYHFIALFSPADFPESPLWRHSLFVVLNIVGTVLAIRRWKWLWIPFALLTIQQLVSHGLRAYEWWTLYNRFDGISILILVCMPVMAVLLYNDFKSRRK